MHVSAHIIDDDTKPMIVFRFFDEQMNRGQDSQNYEELKEEEDLKLLGIKTSSKFDIKEP